jgi:hypothetical protein
MASQTKPSALKPHGMVPRGLASVPISKSFAGRFGRLFRNLAPFEPSDEDLTLLGNTLIEKDEDVEAADNAPSNNDRIAAGFTYLGQFVDHDLTFDPVSKLQRDNDPDSLEDFRTPRFDLDSVYSRGPDDAPFIYDKQGSRMLIGKNETNELDLPRNDNGRGLLGDPRNDENLIVSQLHLAFLKYHNRVADEIAASSPAIDPATLFEQSRRTVLWHYQWILVHEFLPLIVGEKVVKDILRQDDFSIGVGTGTKTGFTWRADLKFYSWRIQPFMPVEFSVAAYRFGHSMIRRDYALNPQTDGHEVPIFDPSQPSNDLANDLRGFRRRPKDRQIEWFRFFEFPGKIDQLQPARAIDTQLVFGLGGLPLSVTPTGPTSLPVRNLLRGKALGLPSGQDVARCMGVPEDLIVSIDNARLRFQVGTGYKLPGGQPDPSVPDIDPAKKARLESAFGRETPLWYYILKEAELVSQGRLLGPVGGRIVAEVFVGILIGDGYSFLRAAPAWQPKKGHFGCTSDGKFGMADLLKHVQ